MFKRLINCQNAVTLSSHSPVGLRHGRFNPSTKRHFTLFQSVADTFLTVHEASQIPWIVLVPLSTITLRTLVTLPFSIWQRKRILKQQELRKLVQPITPIVKLRLAAITNKKSKNTTKINFNGTPTQLPLQDPGILNPEQITFLAVKETRKRQKKLFKKYSVPLWKNALLPMVQIPLWVTVSMGIRTLTEEQLLENYYPSWIAALEFGSFDLSSPLTAMPLLAPILVGTLAVLNVEYNGRLMFSSSMSSQGMKTVSKISTRVQEAMASILNVSRLGCVVMLAMSSQAPFLLSLYWISSQLYSLVQNIILNWVYPYQR
ncbi:cox18p [Saccharomyces arboricola H-6]|uniref:Cox18p n=1 Tax=Saccharomyces arboricola (strain H-6 / AS 2.3317 / CBS 10644) TaxID=1160507 RepID=J8PNI1_SACAR|nr:cox18p [Saccharomyces arboricola H-6]